nr:zinc finger BED domain-containing protein RICESLEEPER 2-like [Ipomoea batatas]
MFQKMANTQFGLSVKIIRSDNGPEFNMREFFTDNEEWQPAESDPSLPIIPTMNYEEFNFQAQEGTQSQATDDPMDNDVHSGSYNDQNNGNFSHVGLMQNDSHINEGNQSVETNGSNTDEPLDNTDSSNNNSSAPTDYTTDDRQLDTSPRQPRRSGRQRQMPLRLQDFYCDLVMYGKSTPHTLSKVVSYDMLEPSHKASGPACPVFPRNVLPTGQIVSYPRFTLNGESKVLTPGARCPVTGLRTLMVRASRNLDNRDGQTTPLRDGGERGRTGIGHFLRKDGQNLWQVGLLHRHLEGGLDVVLHCPPPAVEGPSAELVHQVFSDRSPGDGSQNGFSGLSASADMTGEQDGVGEDLLSQVRTLQDSAPGLLGCLELAFELLDPLVPLSKGLLEGRHLSTVYLVPVFGPGEEIGDGVGHLQGYGLAVEVDNTNAE